MNGSWEASDCGVLLQCLLMCLVIVGGAVIAFFCQGEAPPVFLYPQPAKVYPVIRGIFLLLPRNEAVPKIITSHYPHNLQHQLA
mmetsp:Transcript_19373/g.29885  ORF Transcript_19373/g.29885 Transcript_19373/m.29885 type:complete len:84 (-) Transcript_19373:70-321(-)